MISKRVLVMNASFSCTSVKTTTWQEHIVICCERIGMNKCTHQEYYKKSAYVQLRDIRNGNYKLKKACRTIYSGSCAGVYMRYSIVLCKVIPYLNLTSVGM